MAEYGYLKVEAGGSAIEGSCTDKGFEKQMVVFEYDHRCYFNFDDVSGVSTSNMHSEPVRAIIKLDESAPELLKAIRKSTPCKITVSWSARDKNGSKVTYFITTFENARIVNWRHYTPNTADRNNQEMPHSMEISWSYEKTTASGEKWDSTAKSHPKKMDTFEFRNPTA